MKKFLLGFCLFTIVVIGSRGQEMMLGTDQIKLLEALHYVNKLYVDTINSKTYTNDVIRLMLENLDPHSTYITKEEVKDAEEPLQGEFEGIGITFNMMTDTVFVIDVIQGGPSERVGIRAGDKLINVNDTVIAGLKLKNTEVIKKLRGSKGTTVNVDVLRKGHDKLIPFTIVRDKIPIYSLDAAFMLDANIGYIRLSRFGATTHKEFLEAYKSLEKQGMTGLILDLQSNGGGYLNAAIDITNEFLNKGDLIVYAEGSRFPKIQEQAKGNGKLTDGKLIVLINETSASASEIVAGAIQDQDRGLIVGRRSFGKGLVQRPLPLSDESLIRLTVARYYTPAGRSIQKHYEPGKGLDYAIDIYNRVENGELYDPNKIQFADSLKYITLNNQRPVYGGGGIMPDEFVVIDTLRYSDYYSKLSSLGLFHKITLAEFDNNRDAILQEYPTAQLFHENYKVPKRLIDQLVQAGVDEKLDFDEEGYEQSKAEFNNTIKALLARDLFDMSLYIKIFNERSDIFNRAFAIISDDEVYNKLLKEGRVYGAVVEKDNK